MEIKCNDCFGANYFCTPCSIQSHLRSPFHRLVRWTGAHFAPVSLYSLGFHLCLGHSGEPCPRTLEVSIPWLISYLCSNIVYKGSDASRRVDPSMQSSRVTRSTSVKPVGNLKTPAAAQPTDKPTKRVRTASLGNPLITVVHQSGICDMAILYCRCPNHAMQDVQLMNAGLFPSSYKQIETAFTFAVLDDFLTDNLECKTTAQQYYSKLQSITSPLFPDSVPVS
jgi:hypothetical protein